MFCQRTLTTLMMTTGRMVMAAPKPIQPNAAGCMTTDRKSLPASSPRQARYMESPSDRSMRFALVVV